MKTKINKTTEKFLNYAFKGDGKYYTIERGSMHYNNTIFHNFYLRNPQHVIIKERGNDAPRNGRTGGYLIVEFTEEFNKIAKDFLDAKREVERQAELEGAEKLALIDKYAALINKVEGEDRLTTQKRMSTALNGEKISATIFHKAINKVRS